jgi:hypothetical protein
LARQHLGGPSEFAVVIAGETLAFRKASILQDKNIGTSLMSACISRRKS